MIKSPSEIQKRVAELQVKERLTEGERLELEYLLSRKWSNSDRTVVY
jgi:hypothetical protein